jgi:hypothetical protein
LAALSAPWLVTVADREPHTVEAIMSTDSDQITDLSDFLRSRPDDWNLQAIGDEAEQEAVFNQLRGIRYVQQEGRDYVEYSDV